MPADKGLCRRPPAIKCDNSRRDEKLMALVQQDHLTPPWLVQQECPGAMPRGTPELDKFVGIIIHTRILLTAGFNTILGLIGHDCTVV